MIDMDAGWKCNHSASTPTSRWLSLPEALMARIDQNTHIICVVILEPWNGLRAGFLFDELPAIHHRPRVANLCDMYRHGENDQVMPR